MATSNPTPIPTSEASTLLIHALWVYYESLISKITTNIRTEHDKDQLFPWKPELGRLGTFSAWLAIAPSKHIVRDEAPHDPKFAPELNRHAIQMAIKHINSADCEVKVVGKTGWEVTVGNEVLLRSKEEKVSWQVGVVFGLKYEA